MFATMRRAQCSENLRQLALATSNYEVSHDSLPGYCHQFGEFAGGVDPSDPGSFAGSVPAHLKIGSWQIAILGKLDNQPIYEHWTTDRYPILSDGNGDRRATNEGYSLVAAANLKVFQCPSASNTLSPHGINQYIANTGMHVDSFPFSYTRPGDPTNQVSFLSSMSRNNGVFNNKYAGFHPASPSQLVPIGKRVRSSDFKDGTSNTMLLSENHQALPWHLTRLTRNTNHLTDIRTVESKRVIAYPAESRYLQGAVWHFEDEMLYAGAATVAKVHKINGGDVYNELPTLANLPDVARPSSLHVAGVNMAMADGSVQYVNDAIGYRVYQAKMTPNGRSSDVPVNEFIPTSEL